mgnify:CR=1 FL=1
MRHFKAQDQGKLEDGYRIAPDGLLERQVKLQPPFGTKWVPIVPTGQATANLSWRRWMFLQCHLGILGGRRNAEKTEKIMRRQVWWPTLHVDVVRWWDECLTCLRFRKLQTKQEQVARVPVDAEAWEEVMIDLEGPNSPADQDGDKYIMTYICCLCHGILLEKAPSSQCFRGSTHVREICFPFWKHPYDPPQ